MYLDIVGRFSMFGIIWVSTISGSMRLIVTLLIGWLFAFRNSLCKIPLIWVSLLDYLVQL